MGSAVSSSSGNTSQVAISQPVETQPISLDIEEDFIYNADEQSYTCKCGYKCFDKMSYEYHAESTNSRKCPKQAPFDPSGWSERMIRIIPYVAGMQRGVIANGSLDHACGTIITLSNNYNANEVFDALSKIPAWTQEAIEARKSPVVSAVGIEGTTWKSWDAAPPKELKKFDTIFTKDGQQVLFPAEGAGHILLWVKASSSDVCYELGKRLALALGENAANVSQTITFKYGSGKDLTGFIDGTRNPDHLLRAIVDEVAIFPQDNYGDHVSGCYMYVGKFVHDLRKFFSMNDHAKSQIIGRDYTKEEPHKRGYDRRIENPRLDEDEYMDESAKKNPTEPAKTRFHTARGHGSMYRQAMPFVEGPNQGLFFIAFSRSLSEFDNALKRMAGHFQPDGSTDALFDITKSISNGYYYVPSLEELQNLHQLKSKLPPKIPEPYQSKDHPPVNNGKPIKIVIEYCTNCGYKTIFLEKKKVLESFGAPGQVEIIENPQIPRLACFEIVMEDGTVIFSKRALPDGMNNYPWCFPSDEELILKLRKYFGADVSKEEIAQAEKARNITWGKKYWDEQPASDNNNNAS
mmetsp:Transcript_2041/g.2678  ORF Transcript_2041/g.2678 Transcript_2041/m.2678 type:complete len:576 (+) Transcript_2041:319-2046(+)